MGPLSEDDFRLAREGDHRAFERLTGGCAEELLRTALGVLRHDRDAAADAVQETFLQAWKGLARIRDAQHFRCWLFAVVRCKSISWLRRRGPPGSKLLRLLPSGSLIREETHYPEVAAPPTGDPEAGERRSRLREALAGLPPSYGGPMVLHYMHGLGTRETGRLLGLPATAVKMRLHRGRMILRRALLGGGRRRATPHPPGNEER